jgi:hypothetical protein
MLLLNASFAAAESRGVRQKIVGDQASRNWFRGLTIHPEDLGHHNLYHDCIQTPDHRRLTRLAWLPSGANRNFIQQTFSQLGSSSSSSDAEAVAAQDSE